MPALTVDDAARSSTAQNECVASLRRDPPNPERRQAAAVCLQRAHRRAARRRPSNSTDPITLEEISAHKDQPLFHYVDASGVLTAMQARPLADYGLAAGEIIHPLSRMRLNACEILRLEHILVGAGFTKYSGLARQLSESVTTISPGSRSCWLCIWTQPCVVCAG